MPQLVVVSREGTRRAVEGEAGLSVMEVIRDNGFDELLALCGGACACATCHVYVGEDWIGRMPTLGADEDALLETADFRREDSRLACQIPFEAELDGLEVTIAPE